MNNKNEKKGNAFDRAGISAANFVFAAASASSSFFKYLIIYNNNNNIKKNIMTHVRSNYLLSLYGYYSSVYIVYARCI